MATPTFNDWGAVADTYGPQVVQMLQNNNVPLDQVGQTITQVMPNYTYGQQGTYGGGLTGIRQTPGGNWVVESNPAVGPLGQFFGGQPQQPQGPSFDPTQNPNYPTSLLGAQALQAVGLNPTRQVTVNPSPANTPSSSQFAQSGVSSVASPQTIQYGRNMPMPQTATPSLFTPASALTPSGGGNPNPLTPYPQATGAALRGPGGVGRPYASVPPVIPPISPPAAPGAGTQPMGGPNPVRPGLGLWRMGPGPVLSGGVSPPSTPPPSAPSSAEIALKT